MIAHSREWNAALNATEYGKRRIVLDSYPTMVYVELTQNCNLSCFMCRSAGHYDTAKNMSMDVFTKVVEELMPSATMVDLRGWGESTILKDFLSLVRISAATGARLRLVTNGLAMTPDMWAEFAANDGVVAVSIDAATQEMSMQLGRGDLDRVVRNVREGVRVMAAAGRGTVYFNTVVSARNRHELPAIVHLASQLGVRRVVLNPVKLGPGDADGLEGIDLRNTLERVEAAALQEGVEILLGAFMGSGGREAYALPSTCGNPWSHVVIAYNGDVIFCDHLIGHHDHAIGNILATPFRQIWNGDVYAALRLAHQAAEQTRRVACVEKCTWCYENRYGESEAAPLGPGHSRAVALAGVGGPSSVATSIIVG